MVLTIALLLHVLMFVYWLGGDLGAFYASFIVLDPNRPPAARAAAANILSNVDMAPRTSLILALPTGITLAGLKGWFGGPLDLAILCLIWGLCAVWMAAAWVIHLRHLPPSALLPKLDVAWRFVLLAGLGYVVITGDFAGVPIAGFLRAKCACYGAAVLCGLAIRFQLRPFGPAIGAILRGESTPQAEALVARLMGRAKIFVVLIWISITTAAILGLSVQA
jgi:hypothetical protein